MTRSSGFFHWVFPLMLGLVALTVLLSGRDLSQQLLELETGSEIVANPLVVWSQRAISVLLLAISIERIFSHLYAHERFTSPLLAWTFLTYWLATVAAPAVLGSHPWFVHEYLYTLVIGFAALLAGSRELDQGLAASRNALFAFMLGSVALIPLEPAMALDVSYSQGLLPGVPRLGGLAPHPVTLGILAQTFLLCLWCKPFGRRWLRLLSWVLGGAVLFLAQSKTAWIAFFVCSAALLAVRHLPGLWRRVGDHRRGEFGALACLAVVACVLGAMGWLLLGNLHEQAQDFFNTSEGTQLMTMTGRDRIWEIALEEWRDNRLFGYGPQLWDAAFRASIGMPNATSAHNQFMDTLARSGSVGAAVLVLYAGLLLALSLRHAVATGGLSLALFLALALNSISEVPLMLFGYGVEFFNHLLLILTLASAAAARERAAPVPIGPIHAGAIR